VATLDDLLVPRDRDTIEAILLSTLQAEGFPVTDWYVGGVARTILKMVASAILDRETWIRYIASGGFLDLASTLVDPEGTPVEGWLEMLAAQNFNLARAPATFTQKTLTLSCASGQGPYTRAAGELKAISQTGNRYVNVASVTIPDGSSVTATFQAESPGLIIDATGTIDQLTTPLPGVSVVDATTQFSTPVTSWTGTGTIVPSATGMPSPARTLKVTIAQSGRIDGTGAPVARFTLTVFTAGTPVTSGPYDVTATHADGDITLTFADGSAGTNSFIAGDVWYVSTPGQPTIQMGADQELLATLAQRCRDMWPALSAIPTEGKYAAWARQCSIEESLGVNRVATHPSTAVAGVVNVYVSDARGTAEASTVVAIQSYIDKRSVDIEYAAVDAATSVTINLTGKVWVKRSQMTEVKAAAKTSWNSYLSGVPIGGEMPGGIVRVSKLDQILEDLGVFNSSELAINAGGTDVDLELDPDEVPAASASGTDALTWYEVP